MSVTVAIVLTGAAWRGTSAGEHRFRLGRPRSDDDPDALW